MDKIILRDKAFTRVDINNKRHFYATTYELGLWKEMNRYRIVCHFVFKDRLKIYDIPQILKIQNSEIDIFLKENPKYNKDNSAFFLIIELKGGLSFSPDLKTAKLFTKNRFEVEKKIGYLFAHVVCIVSKSKFRLARLMAPNYFGFKKGEGYDFASNYDEAVESIMKFNKILEYEALPELVRREVESGE